VVASDKLARLGPVGAFRKLDYSRLPSSKNLDPALRAALATFDPGNEHAVGYLWGTSGIGYDARKLQALAPDAPTDSWRLAFDAKEVAAMAGCGVSIVDAPSEGWTVDPASLLRLFILVWPVENPEPLLQRRHRARCALASCSS
jgi:spermidine/putrescine-binding protein